MMEVEPPEKQSHFQIAGFWHRLVALAIDLLLLGVIGVILGSLLFDQLAHIGVFGRLVGFAIALAYFGVLNSKIGSGQTLGKRLLGVRVVGSYGEQLSLPRSMLRYTILGVPFFLNNASIGAAATSSVFAYIYSLALFGGMFSIVYLYLFNRRTRQSLHDLVVGSYAVDAVPLAEAVPRTRVWHGHLVVVALFTMILLASPLLLRPLVRIKPFTGMLATRTAIAQQPHVQFASVNSTWRWGHPDNATFASQIRLDSPMTDDHAFAMRTARLMLANYPQANTASGIVVTLDYGYDIGIASGWKEHSYSFRPDELR